MTEIESKQLELFLRKLLVSLGGGDAIHWAPEHDGQSLKY
jgi:hypothetical protein